MDAPLLGELASVTEKIEEYLTNTALISDDLLWQAGSKIDIELQSLFRNLVGYNRDRIVDHWHKKEGLRPKCQTSSSDLRTVKYLIHGRKHGGPGTLYSF